MLGTRTAFSKLLWIHLCLSKEMVYLLCLWTLFICSGDIYAAHCIWVTSEHILLPPLSWLQGVLGIKLNSNLICPIELDPSNVGNNDGTDLLRWLWDPPNMSSQQGVV